MLAIFAVIGLVWAAGALFGATGAAVAFAVVAVAVIWAMAVR